MAAEMTYGSRWLIPLIGQHPEVFATGKLRNFPHGDVFSDSNVCSCGARASSCTFWTEVRTRFASDEDKPDPARIPALFRLISEISGRSFIGDVTHNTGYAELLCATRGIELFLIHVLRDHAAVVHSGISSDYRAGRLERYSPDHIRRVVKLTRRWSRQIALLTRLERRLGPRAVRIRYEDLCKSPRAALKPVGACLGLDFDAIADALAKGEAFKPIPHMLRGNRRLRTSKQILLQQDKVYRTEMSWPDRAIAGLVSRVPVFRVAARDSPIGEY
jgi:hypothetical protein